MKYEIQTNNAESFDRTYTLKVYGEDGGVIFTRESRDYTLLKIIAERDYSDAKQSGDVIRRK